ncbi:MAG: FAD-dependent oxidoreductase [Acidobacteriota bacterium]
MIDVAIVGGGVAGSATAMVLARRGLSVVVLERSTYQNLRIGETLPPIARETLTTLGVWDRFLRDGHAPSFGTCAAWGSSTLEANDFIFNPHGHGWHVNRAQFDRMLAAAARDVGAVIREGTRLISHRRLPDGWELQIEQPGRPERLQARFLVDAGGRASWVARANGARRIRYDRLVGIASIHDLRNAATEVDSFTMVEAVQGGWWYSAFLPGRQLITVFLTDADLRPRHVEIRGTQHTSGRLTCCEAASPPFVFSATSACLSQAVGPGWLAVGDAACSFDPLSSQGIVNAMRSGMAAAEAIAESNGADSGALERYAAQVQQSFGHYLSVRQRYYGRERRWPQDAFWSRRH